MDKGFEKNLRGRLYQLKEDGFRKRNIDKNIKRIEKNEMDTIFTRSLRTNISERIKMLYYQKKTQK